jgi:hypothetical protein
MSNEFGNWNDLTRLWHKESASLPVGDIERQVRLQRQQMVALATCEGAIMVLSLIACVWIAMQTTLITLSGISFTFFGVCAFLEHRMRREPVPSGGDDLLSSLENSVARDEWNLAQLGIGRAVSFLTLFAISMIASDHLRHFATTPPARLWALLAITAVVLAVLGGNLLLTRSARLRKMRIGNFARGLRAGPEFKASTGW